MKLLMQAPDGMRVMRERQRGAVLERSAFKQRAVAIAAMALSSPCPLLYLLTR